MNTTSPSRALVLGGGGSAGNAWLIGVLAGLADAGLDVADADLIVGTSAGATAAAQLAGAPAHDLFDEILSTAVPSARPGRGPMTGHLDRLRSLIASSADAADMRRRKGAAAIDLAMASDGGSARWRDVVAARFPARDWPDRAMLLTAVDAETGEPLALGRDSGVDLVDAVAASTSGGPAYRLGDRWLIDGGYRANADNADLATGHDRVLVLSPLGGRSLHPVEWGTHLAGQVDELRAAGARVETVFPDEASLTAFGENMMDPSTRPPAARAGFDQGSALAAALRAFWAGPVR